MENIKELSIVIPCYNEEKILEKNLIIIQKYLELLQIKYEIILVNDGSIDNTEKIINKYVDNNKIKKFSYLINQGKGYAVKQGFFLSKYEYILFADMDNSTPIETIKDFDKNIKYYDIIIASRFKKNKLIKKQSLLRRILGNCFRILVWILFGMNYYDTQCGFKLFKKECIKKISNKLKINRWAFDVEILYLAMKYKYYVSEQSVYWYNREDSRVNPIKDSIKMFFDLLYIRIIHLFD
jgi:dolichyl-phosphate beta-glucosyltransferase